METPEVCILSGYELNNPDVERFETKILEVHGPCNECEFLGRCLTPCESVRCLMPKEGQLVNLGRERAKDGAKVTYYALLQDELTSYYRLSEPEHRWARASRIDEEQVPGWAKSRLNGNPD